MSRTKVVIMGAAGRDFHDFNVVFRDDPSHEVVAFTATQIPNIEGRLYPPELSGELYPNGVPIHPESELESLIAEHGVDQAVLSYSDISHETVMHLASRVVGAGCDFRLLSLERTLLRSTKPVIAVCATRTGCGKSQVSRYVAAALKDAGKTPVAIRHPMPYRDLRAQRVQRFASEADFDAASDIITIEEREEYEPHVAAGTVVHAGVDYQAILTAAETEADVIIWDGGNNDLPFYRPDVHITVVDPLRPGHELRYHPGETTFRMADVLVINKVDSASPEQLAEVMENIAAANPKATVVQTASPVQLEPGPDVEGKRVLVVEDGPTTTHGGMPFGAGTVAARQAGAAEMIDPRPYAVGSIIDVFEQYPEVGALLPAMGYGDAQLRDLEATIQAVPADVVITGTPIDLGRLIDAGHPLRHAMYGSEDVGEPTLADVLAEVIASVEATAGD